MFNAETYVECYDCYNKTVSPLGFDVERQATHSVHETLTLHFNGSSKILYKKDREYSSEMAFKRRGQGIAWEVWTINRHITNFFDGVVADNYSGSFNDSIKSELHNIVYMDLRNDILITEDQATEITVNGGGVEAPLYRPEGHNNFMIDLVLYSFVKFPAVSISHAVEAKASDNIVNRTTTPQVGNSVYERKIAIDASHGFTWDPRLSELEGIYKPWEQYFYLGVPNPEHDGFDYYRPFWQQDSSLWEDLDNSLDDAYFGAMLGDNSPENNLYRIPLADPSGGVAVDASGNMLVSYKDPAGKVINVLKNKDGTEFSPITILKIEGTNPVIYPVAPA